ncbi:MAG TPA: dihydrodipicolinate synthase family protein [bacterium]|nr:dihydrodipicolinate synthase family protein [bacterium]
MDLRGLLPPVITPFRNGAVDGDSIARLVESCAPYLDGLVVAGSTGEGPSMTLAERVQTVRFFSQAMRGRLRLIVGVAETNLENIREIVRAGDAEGAVAYLVPLPFYFKHTSETITAFYREVSGFTDREIIVYDNPYTTKTVLTVADYARLREVRNNIRHVKVTDTTVAKIDAAKAAGGMILLAGDDGVMQHQVLRGCEGAVTAVLQVFPQESRAWFDRTREGDLAASTRLFASLLPFINELAIGADEYPAVVKWALRHRGVIASDEMRLPISPLTDFRRRVLERVMAVMAG